MTPEEFDAALARCNKQFREGRKAVAARRVLVDGVGQSEAGRELGMQRNEVWDAVARVEREHKARVGAPPGWACITVCVPRFGEEADAIREIEKGAWRRAGIIS